ncbi:MAG: hypothetical protein GX045_02250 [Clostridiaceae bacterium]|nr:hypothetical protein [Clostridiaceae bacterium]
MNNIAILRSRFKDNSLFLSMWKKAFDFWGIQHRSLYADDIDTDVLNKYEALLVTGEDYIPDNTYQTLDMYLANGGNILISGELPDGLRKYFNGLKVKRIKRNNVHRCMRIKNKNGFQQWDDGEILFFTGTFNCNGIDYITDGSEIENAEIPAFSEEMVKSCEKPGLWSGWRETDDPAVIIKNCGRGKILFTPFAIGAMTEMYHPVSADSMRYLYANENHGIYL